MRLHRHDEILEAMRQALLRVKPGKSDRELLGEAYATAALDAMLEAVVELKAARECKAYHFIDGTVWPSLILRMEASDDK